MANKTAIVTGCTGQDGSYMYELLRSKGYYVLITLRDVDLQKFVAITKPDEVYNFAGVSDVINPYDNVAETMAVNVGFPANILEAITKYSPHTKFFQASSCLAINNTFPYGVSKNAADNLVKQYRDNFGIYACSGIMYPHESPRRKDHFFTKKIINAVKNKQRVSVSDVSASREFGYAPEFMEAAWLMLQQDKPKDYEIGTGKPYQLIYFIEKAFTEAGIDFFDYVTIEKTIQSRAGMVSNPNPILSDLGWQSKTTIEELIKIMINENTA